MLPDRPPGHDPRMVSAARRMCRWIAIELNIGDFKPTDLGQIELYLRWLDRHEQQHMGEPPLGISGAFGDVTVASAPSHVRLQVSSKYRTIMWRTSTWPPLLSGLHHNYDVET